MLIQFFYFVDENSVPSGHLESKVLKAVIDKVNQADENLGLKPQTFFQHVLLSFADNRSLGARQSLVSYFFHKSQSWHYVY